MRQFDLWQLNFKVAKKALNFVDDAFYKVLRGFNRVRYEFLNLVKDGFHLFGNAQECFNKARRKLFDVVPKPFEKAPYLFENWLDPCNELFPSLF